ncbi:DNA oxidative demethylase ALKBH2 isoform X2 [Onychostruthus taczanowskii]|uniref:DNA oxidative demethylase ALKBH2 isoform X2 n=1 Tax=Onychostruthus taczanowskii TaxID=356909 RepID=UPI001B80C083|nr:DNA oxidative demethylase ALKBH2 isoform X2 [Onychostruthus taczanowskii]
MDRFVVKLPRGQPGDGGGKRPRLEKAGPERPPPRKIRAEGLRCDYRILFDKAEADEIFQELEKEVEYFEDDATKLQVFGKWHKIPRKKVTYGDPGLSYTYSGVTFHPKPWIPVLTRIRERVTSETGHSFNFVLINRYKDGLDHIGEHRDDEKELVPRSPIASVSFGACRDFVFRRRGAGRISVALAHGSLLLMEHPSNVHWHHSLPPRRGVLAPRVNLTFRNVLPAATRGNVPPLGPGKGI